MLVGSCIYIYIYICALQSSWWLPSNCICPVYLESFFILCCRTQKLTFRINYFVCFLGRLILGSISAHLVTLIDIRGSKLVGQLRSGNFSNPHKCKQNGLLFLLYVYVYIYIYNYTHIYMYVYLYFIYTSIEMLINTTQYYGCHVTWSVLRLYYVIQP